MKSKASPNKIPRDSCKKAVKLCINNAERFIKDSKLLINDKSYNHAFALLVLSYEELSKAFICFLGSEGLIEIKNKYLNFMRKHIKKQMLQKDIILINLIINPLIKNLLNAIKSPDANDPIKGKIMKGKIINNHISFLKRCIQNGTQESEQIENKIRWFKEMEKQKQSALYIDFDEQGQPIYSSLINKKRVIEFLNQAEERIKVMNEIFKKLPTDQEKDFVRKLLDKTGRKPECGAI